MTTEVKPAWADLDRPKLGEAIEEKAKNLHKIFDEFPDISQMPEAKALEIKPMNDELSEMGERMEELNELHGAKDAAKKWSETFKDIKPPPQPEGEGKQRKQAFKSLGAEFVESDAFKAFSESKQKGINFTMPIEALHGDFEVKGTLGTDDSLTGVDTEYPIQNLRLPGILTPREQPLTIASLIPQARTDGNAIPYMEETTTTNAAAETEQAAAKPESEIGFEEKSTPVRKIATWLPVTEEMFSDYPAMRGYVNGRLRTFVLQREDGQLLNGDGTPPNLEGIYNVSGIQTQAKGSDPTPDAIYKAITKIWTGAFFAASGIVMNPLDWEPIRLLRTADGVYIWGSPSEMGTPRIWSLPVVQTTRNTQNTALVGAFREASMIFRREDVNIRVADQHADFAVENKLAIIAEERLALMVQRPAGFCTVTGI
jgi:HK97 family phage major capsid protein